MHNYRSLCCYNCNAVILDLTEPEISKLNGLNFQCECCGHQNLLYKFKFYKGENSDPSRNTFSADSITDPVFMAHTDTML